MAKSRFLDLLREKTTKLIPKRVYDGFRKRSWSEKVLELYLKKFPEFRNRLPKEKTFLSLKMYLDTLARSSRLAVDKETILKYTPSKDIPAMRKALAAKMVAQCPVCGAIKGPEKKWINLTDPTLKLEGSSYGYCDRCFYDTKTMMKG